mgnify:CR=1 FL=1
MGPCSRTPRLRDGLDARPWGGEVMTVYVNAADFIAEATSSPVFDRCFEKRVQWAADLSGVDQAIFKGPYGWTHADADTVPLAHRCGLVRPCVHEVAS